MNEKEIMQWAIKGIEADVKKLNKRLLRALYVVKSHENGSNDGKFDRERAEKRIADIRAEIELLIRKKAFLIVQLENK